MLVLPNHLLSIILKQFSNKLPELQKPQLTTAADVKSFFKLG